MLTRLRFAPLTLKCVLNWSRLRCCGGKNSMRRSSSRAFFSSATRSSMLSVARKSAKNSVTNARMVPCMSRHGQKIAVLDREHSQKTSLVASETAGTPSPGWCPEWPQYGTRLA